MNTWRRWRESIFLMVEPYCLKTRPASNLGKEAMEHASLYSVFWSTCAPAPVSGMWMSVLCQGCFCINYILTPSLLSISSLVCTKKWDQQIEMSFYLSLCYSVRLHIKLWCCRDVKKLDRYWRRDTWNEHELEFASCVTDVEGTGLFQFWRNALKSIYRYSKVF